ncbi:hypothetical protein GXP67_32700 [Rhodocytophaga rosea]|uniref:Uncharacterized protein n=1 Tax=Rhodocytophaga rosea TaxID=2704465 RepID=A0A6C0GST2_9BACT|nr:hypothetical protein [Rhodocytophaga rosea]QHT71076.1 hypothetical protein GXP67_32700 [Rhodocytophaga rosea]
MPSKNSNNVYKNIGSKIKDFHWIYVNIGPSVAKSALESSYGNDADEIFKGLEVYHQYGMDVYMNPKDEREV